MSACFKARLCLILLADYSLLILAPGTQKGSVKRASTTSDLGAYEFILQIAEYVIYLPTCHPILDPSKSSLKYDFLFGVGKNLFICMYVRRSTGLVLGELDMKFQDQSRKYQLDLCFRVPATRACLTSVTKPRVNLSNRREMVGAIIFRFTFAQFMVPKRIHCFWRGNKLWVF